MSSRLVIPHVGLQRAGQSPFVIMIVAFALLVGTAVGRGHWIAGIAMACALVLIVSPIETALGLFALVVPFDMSPIPALGGKTATWAVGIFAAVVIFVAGVATQRLQGPPKVALWWTVFICWCAVTILWATDAHAVLTRLPTACSLLVLFLVVSSVRLTSRELYMVSLLAIAGGVVAALWASHEAAGGLYYHQSSMRASLVLGGSETDPNIFSASLLLPVSLAVGGFLTVRRWSAKLIMLAAVAAMGYAIFLSMSRGALLALSVMALVYLIRMRLNWRIFVPVLCVIALIPLIPDLLFVRIHQAQETGDIRTWIWMTGLRSWANHPVRGLGLDNFPVATGPHSFLISITVELGIVGLFLFLTSVGLQLWRARKTPFLQIATGFPIVSYEAACWSMMVAALFLDIIWRKFFWLNWSLLAIAVSLNRPGHERITQRGAE